MAFNGVRMSWDMFRKKACLEASLLRARSKASSSSLRSWSCRCFWAPTSRKASTTSPGARDSS